MSNKRRVNKPNSSRQRFLSSNAVVDTDIAIDAAGMDIDLFDHKKIDVTRL